MFYFLLGIYFFYVAAKAILAILQISFIRAEVKRPAVVLSQREYETAAAAAITNQKFEIASLLYHAAIFMMWACWGLGAISGHAYKTGDIGDNVFMVMVFLLVSSLLELPLNIYETFVKDKRLGFSNVTPKIFALDLLKTLALTLVFGTLFVWLVLLCIRFLGDFWWFWAFLLSFMVALVINLIYPTLIAPIFNKMQPLEEGELKSRIEGLLAQCGFKSSGVFTIDASKRDKRLNAYFGGFGATKKVVLFDTLIEKLSEDEILAVLGHELGHFKHGDILKNLALSFVLLGATFAVFGNLPGGVFSALGLNADGGATLVFMILFAPILHAFFEPVISKFSRMHEFSADQHGASMQDKESMIGALKKLGSENKAFPLAHKIYAAVYHSHPSLYERIRELDEDR